MGTTSDSTPAPKRRPRTAAEQRAERATTSNDPEVLAAEIEKTREELAETLDAIADKVSPKRVVSRTKKKAADAAEGAKETVKAGTGQLKEAVLDKKDAVAAKVGSGDEAGEDAALGTALEGVGQDPGAEGAGGTTAALGAPVVTSPPAPVAAPVTPPVPAPVGLRPVPPPPASSSPLPLGPPAAAGAAVAALVTLLLLRRRRSRRRSWR